MMKKICSIPKVRKMVSYVSEEEYLFIDDQKRFCKMLNHKISFLINEIDCEVLERWDEGFLVNENKYFVNSELIDLFENNVYKQIVIDDSRILVKKIDLVNESIQWGIYQKDNKYNWFSVLENISPKFYLSDENIISVHNNDTILSTHYKGNINWSHKFADIVQIQNLSFTSKFILLEDILYVIIESYQLGNHGLFCFGIGSGTLLRRYKGKCYTFFEDQSKLYFTKDDNLLCEIDPKTFKLNEWDIAELVKQNNFKNIYDNRSIIQNGLFYITQTLGDIKSKFGILNIANKSFDYKFEFDPANGGIGNIEGSNSRIFLQTQDNTMHVFENEAPLS